MKQYTHKEFIKILNSNGYLFSRRRGSHSIYINIKGRHISVPDTLKCVVARRLIRENNLIL